MSEVEGVQRRQVTEGERPKVSDLVASKVQRLQSGMG